MSKLKLVALALVSASALGTLPALAESAVATHIENAWKSDPTFARQPYDTSWRHFENQVAARESPVAMQAAMTTKPTAATTSDPTVGANEAARLEGAQPSFADDTTAATRHHGVASSGSATAANTDVPAEGRSHRS